jgi:oligoribonuclease
MVIKNTTLLCKGEDIMQRSDCFVWIDLEMTGLNPDEHVIIEMATIITDQELNVIEEGPVFVIHQPKERLESIDPWVLNLHTKTGLLKLIETATTSQNHAEKKTLEFIKRYCEKGTARLAGNSVWSDRAFLIKHMPSITEYLHYRLIDVSTVKGLVNCWYPKSKQTMFKKSDSHRALSDIRESIAELKHYRAYFFVR